MMSSNSQFQYLYHDHNRVQIEQAKTALETG